MKLRGYQSRACSDVYQALREVQSVILQLPTGAGKTHCAIAIIKHGLEHGRRINFCADRLTLIDQTFEKFMEHGIRCGVVQADHPARDPARPVQIISLQTLKRRRQWPDADLWIVDEAHDQHQVTYEAMVRGAKFIGLTATPFTTGLGLHWNRLVVGVTTAELIEAGYLSPYKAYGPSAPDMKGVGTTAGDYTKSEMEPRVREIIGSVVNHYMEHGEGRKALCFAVNVAHAKDLAGQFQAAGLEADYVEGRDTPDRRHEVLGKFRRGDLDVVVNCEVLTKGFDLPDIGCLILARPTRSLSLHIQMIGRGLRAAPGKDYCLILDHAGNIERLGFPDDDLPRELCMKEKGVSSADKREKKDPMPWNCPDCTHLNPEDVVTCSVCGHTRKRPSRVVSTTSKLVELTKGTNKQAAYSMLLCHAQAHKYSTGWVAHKYRTLFGVWPRKMQPTLLTPTPEMKSWIKSEQIRYAKRRSK